MVIDDQDAGVAIIQRIGDLRRAPAGVDRIEHAAAPPHAHHVFEVAVRIEREHADPVAFRHAEPAQRGGEARDMIREFAERAPASLERDRHPIRILLQRAMQALGQIHALLFLPRLSASGALG